MAASSSSRPLGLHQGDELPGDEGKGDEQRRQDQPGSGEDDLEVVFDQPGAEPTLSAKQQYIDQTGHHRRHRERQIDQGDQEVLAAKVEFGDRPGRRDPEGQIQGDRHPGGQEGQGDRRQSVGFRQRGEVEAQSLAQRLGKKGEERQQQKEREKTQGDPDQHRLHPRRFASGGIVLEAPRLGGPMGGDGAAHIAALPCRCSAQNCRPLMRNKSVKETESMTRAMAVAPG